MNAVGRLLLERGRWIEAFVEDHTEGFEEYRDFLLESDWVAMVAASGVPEATVDALADRIARARALLSFYCMGLNQSTVGMWKNNSLINLHLLTGQIGKPGAGPFSLTGQPNAMGGREAGLLSHQLPGYRFGRRPRPPRRGRGVLGRGRGRSRERPGLTAVEMFRALEKGRLKAIWIAGTNPAVSLPDLHQVRRALAKAELIVVQDAYHPTETTPAGRRPAPRGPVGREGRGPAPTASDSCRHSEQVVNPPGAALPDWEILARFGEMHGLLGVRVRLLGARSGTSSSS